MGGSKDDSPRPSVSSDSLLPEMEKYITRLPSWARGPAEILAGAAEGYGSHRASRMAAAISYRTVFALAPLLIIAVAVLGSFLGSQAEAQQRSSTGSRRWPDRR